MRKAAKIFGIIIVLLGLIQLIPVDKTNQPVNAVENFVDINQSNQQVRHILRNACYDCHSNEVVYPDYAYVAPVSWMVKDHVNEGRSRLDFSKWGTYNLFQKQGMMEKSIASVEGYSMPLPSYISQHPKANLTKAEREILINHFRDVLKLQK